MVYEAQVHNRLRLSSGNLHNPLPCYSHNVILGNGQVLTADKENLGDCELSVEIKEVRARAFCYSRRFPFILDGSTVSEFDDAAYPETDDGLCLIAQPYYEEESNRMGSCTLVYQKDFSYAVIRRGERLYFLSNGASIPFPELPIS